MGSNEYERSDVLEAINQRIDGTMTLHEAEAAVDAAETPREWERAQQRVRDVIAANNRTRLIWIRKWQREGRL
jgi:hypothetical protein